MLVIVCGSPCSFSVCHKCGPVSKCNGVIEIVHVQVVSLPSQPVEERNYSVPQVPCFPTIWLVVGRYTEVTVRFIPQFRRHGSVQVRYNGGKRKNKNALVCNSYNSCNSSVKPTFQFPNRSQLNGFPWHEKSTSR